MNDESARVIIDPSSAPTSDLLPAFMRFLRVAQYRRSTIIVSLCIAALLGCGYFLLAPRYFRSTAKLLIIQQTQDQVSPMSDHASNENVIATHRELVRSAVVLKAAIADLAPEHRIDFQNLPPREWIPQLHENLHANTTRNTNFIEVSFRSRHPEAAAAVVRAIIDSYVRFVEVTHQGSAAQLLDILTTERDQLQSELAKKQAGLQEFRQRIGHLATNTTDAVVEPVVQRALFLNETLMEAQQRRLDLQGTLAAVEAAVRNGEDVSQHLVAIEGVVGRQVLLSAMGMSHQDMLLLSDQEKTLLKLQAELKSLRSFYAAEHPRVVELQDQIAATEKFLAEYQSNASERFARLNQSEFGPAVREMLSQAVRQAIAKEEQLAVQFEEAKQLAVRHSGDVARQEMLEREVHRLETLHDVLFEKIATVDMRQVQAPIQATVVEEPLPDEVPVSPQLRNLIGGCLLGGLFVGALIVYVQDVLDDRFSSPEEMAGQVGAPVLSIVQKLDHGAADGLSNIHVHRLGTTAETEAFRTLRTAIALTPHVTERILVSSSEPGDGKTTISANLAASFAQAGKKTLIIDADLRKPGLTALAGMKGIAGVADLLHADAEIASLAPQIVQMSDVPNLDVIPAGLRRPNPAELLSSQRLVDLLAWADSVYDQVVVDCPPVLAVSDAQIVGQLVDGAILVVRPEKNHRRLVMRACESFRATGTTVIGLVANGVSAAGKSYGYGYGYGYGYSYGGHEETDGDDAPATVAFRSAPHGGDGSVAGDGKEGTSQTTSFPRTLAGESDARAA